MPYSTWDVAGTFVCQSTAAPVVVTFVEPGLEIVRVGGGEVEELLTSPAQPTKQKLLAASNARTSKPLSVTNVTGVRYGSNWTQDGKEDKCAHRTFSWTRGQARKPNTLGLWISSTLFGNNQMPDGEHRRIKAITLKIGRLFETCRREKAHNAREIASATRSICASDNSAYIGNDKTSRQALSLAGKSPS